MQSIARSQASNDGRRNFYSIEKTEREIRQFMIKFDELTQQSILQNVLIKLWKLLIKLQYYYEDPVDTQTQSPTIRDDSGERGSLKLMNSSGATSQLNSS